MVWVVRSAAIQRPPRFLALALCALPAREREPAPVERRRLLSLVAQLSLIHSAMNAMNPPLRFTHPPPLHLRRLSRLCRYLPQSTAERDNDVYGGVSTVCCD